MIQSLFSTKKFVRFFAILAVMEFEKNEIKKVFSQKVQTLVLTNEVQRPIHKDAVMLVSGICYRLNV